jgi:hypothetical protein
MDDEFSEVLPKAYRPNFPKELGHMAVNPFTREKLVVETLIDFVNFDENMECQLEQGVRVVKTEGHFYVYQGEEKIAKVKDKVTINPMHYATTQMFKSEKSQLCDMEDGSLIGNTMKSSPMGFTPPHFGVTVLGASHGFDASGSTSGYIVWVNQRGIMIDPPPFSS